MLRTVPVGPPYKLPYREGGGNEEEDGSPRGGLPRMII